MFGLVKMIGAAVAGGAVLGAIGSSKIGNLFNRDGEKARVKKSQVRFIEIPYDEGDPDNVEIVLVKKTKRANISK